MRRYEAPAKLNLALLVHPPDDSGYHPLDSLVQTVEWCDRLEISEGEGRDRLEVTGADLDPDDNLVLQAVSVLRRGREVRPLSIRLAKEIPLSAGLGGGSSDAAAALMGAAELEQIEDEVLERTAAEVGADVVLFLTGGTLRLSGYGEKIESIAPLEGFAFAVAVPPFGLSTAEVYRRWDQLEGPVGDEIPRRDVPPPLRDGIPLRNDLLPAALAVEPRLGDFMADLRSLWGTAVCLTGSGSGCFAYFPTVDEAGDAAVAAASMAGVARAVDLRDRGVSPADR